MCGLVGVMSHSQNGPRLKNIVERMKRTIQHRGPDDHGIFMDPNVSLVLGHQRLAIIDPENGVQPLSTIDGRYTVVFNGAIYNYLELRRELINRGYPIRSYSDTEVIPYAYMEWGKDCLNHFRGMFAFALWDKAEKVLFCARDRVGIKPFYYCCDGKNFVFGSEIKAILASGFIEPKANTQALQDYITFQFCLEDKTLFDGIYKLEPGHFLVAKMGKGAITLEKKQYWDVSYKAHDVKDEKFYIDNLVSLLEDSIRVHLRSDVPLGAHLSGGLDSSTVVCLAAQMLKGISFKTFTGAFSEGKQFDETEYAKEVAASAGCDYNEIYISGQGLGETLSKLIYFMDEPLAGPGLIPQYYVSQLAANQKVKVVLGGQGGDELYVGYARYMVAYLEKCLQAAIWPATTHGHDNISLQSIMPNLPMLHEYKPMLQNFFAKGLFESDDKRYFRLADRSGDSKPLYNPDIFQDYGSFARFENVFNKPETDSLINKITHFDLKASLPALLHVEDRTSMAVSLESRVPLLDHKLVEFIASVPPQLKFANGKPKHLFREAIKNITPPSVLNRKDKMGFPVPLDHWFKGVAKEFTQDVLFSQTTKQRGLYDTDYLEKLYQGEQRYSRVLWGIMCLELWHRTFIDNACNLVDHHDQRECA